MWKLGKGFLGDAIGLGFVSEGLSSVETWYGSYT